MTICAPNSRKWPALIKALIHFDKDEMIFDVFKNAKNMDNFLRELFDGFVKKRIVLDQFEPRLKLDHDLPEKLNLLDVEREVFYLMHYLCYAWGNSCKYVTIMRAKTNVMQAILNKMTPRQTAIDLKASVCDDVKIDCLILENNPTWMNCLNPGNGSIYEDWCNKCQDLSACLLGYNADSFIQLTIDIFYTWRKYFNKDNLIHVAMMIFFGDLIVPGSTIPSFKLEFGNYFKNITPIVDANLTLLDTWAFITGDTQSNQAHFGDLYDSSPLESLKTCSKNKTKESCTFVETMNKLITDEDQNRWGSFQDDLYNELIQLCSYDSESLDLRHCTSFKISEAYFKHGQCFTFNETSFIPKLGKYKGLNILVNYAYPGTYFERKEPISISLHEPRRKPDIMNMKGKNYNVIPGRISNLRISATIIDTTEDFDAMSFESRLCEANASYGEVNCMAQAVINRAMIDCDCLPANADIQNAIHGSCDALGMICFKESISKLTRDMDLNGCYKACQRIQYGLNLQADVPMTDILLNKDIYGKEVEDYFLQPRKLYDFFGKAYAENDIWKPKLERTSLIYINFEDLELMTVTKDAKITLPDMIGNIGGTLGVFIGFSFIGLLDALIELFQYVKRKIMKSHSLET